MSKKKPGFEERLERLEEIRHTVNDETLPLEETIRLFEEGITLSRALEKELEQIEAKIEILVNEPEADEKPQFEGFET